MRRTSTAPVVVVGDALLDIDLLGTAERICPDAPVPVVEVAGRRTRPGGAALAAVLAARLSDRPVVLLCPIAGDDAGNTLRELVSEDVELVSLPAYGSTAVKTRVRVGDSSVVRLDSGCGASARGGLTVEQRALLESAAVVLVSDYGNGTSASPELRAQLGGRRAPVVWDPHPRGSEPVAGARLVTPNAREALTLLGEAAPGAHLADLAEVGRRLAERWRAGAVAVTSGASGVALTFGAGAPLLVPADPVAGRDACGAGDSFAAAAAVALADGALVSEAVRTAVATASAFVAAGGAGAVVARDEASPPPGPEDSFARRSVPGRGTVVATGGCFDVLHAGHIATLTGARKLGDRLVVCVNSDASVRRLKGAGRPVVPIEDRVRVLQALECVDEVVVFEQDTPDEVLARLRPDIWVKGGDYAGAELPEAAVLARWGGRAVVLPYLAGRSTTAIVDRRDRPSDIERAGDRA